MSWGVTLAGNIDPARVTLVVTRWASLLDGVVVVSDRAPALPQLAIPVVWVQPRHPFSRSSWRNIGVRCAPDDWLVVFDIDVVPVRPGVLELVKAPGWPATLCAGVIWLDDRGTEAVFAGQEPEGGTEGGPWSGIVAGRRLNLIAVSWDDNMRLWGAEDEDFVLRAREIRAMLLIPRAVAHLNHEHRQSLGRKEQLRVNRAAAGPERADRSQWWPRAWREIVMEGPAPDQLGIGSAQDAWSNEAEVRRWISETVAPGGHQAVPHSHLVSPAGPDCRYEPLWGCVAHLQSAGGWTALYEVPLRGSDVVAGSQRRQRGAP